MQLNAIKLRRRAVGLKWRELRREDYNELGILDTLKQRRTNIKDYEINPTRAGRKQKAKNAARITEIILRRKQPPHRGAAIKMPRNHVQRK
jgi:hypothetical protein